MTHTRGILHFMAGYTLPLVRKQHYYVKQLLCKKKDGAKDNDK